MSQVRRPKPGEDDLEEMMRQFEEQKLKPSASSVNKRQVSSPEEDAKRQKSLFSQRRAKKTDGNAEKENLKIKFQLPDQSEKDENENGVNENVLNEIIEKNISGNVMANMPTATSKLFPDVMNSSNFESTHTISCSGKKKSLFSQKFQQMKRETAEKDMKLFISQTISIDKEDVQEEGGVDNGSGGGGSVNLDCFGDESRIVTGLGLEKSEEAISIHNDNVEMLKQMSEHEILEEKKKFSKSLDPKLIEFLQKRGKKAKQASTVKKEVRISEDVKIQETGTGAASCPPSDNLTKYPGMSQVESGKLKWTGELPNMASSQLSGFSARFGFDGRLLRPDTEVPVTAGLHHHGEEQERPGYTAEEMLILARSTNNRQRQLGLELLEAVLHVWWTGEMDHCLEQNLVTELIRAGLVQVIRLSLDSSEVAMTVAGLRCLVALLCCQEEERLLDWVVDTQQPGLAPVIEDGGDDDEQVEAKTRLTDHQLVCEDLVLGLVRMDTLDRCHYLLSVEQYRDTALVTGILATLVRLARHSLNMSARLARHPLTHLLVTSNPANPLSIKLVRVLASWNSALALEVVSSLDIGQRLGGQLAGEVESLYDTQLSVECHKLLCLMLEYNMELGHYLWSQLYPVLVSRLMLLYNTDQLTDPSCVGAWLILAAGHHLSQCPDLALVLENCVTKWIAQLSQLPKSETPSPTFLQLVSVTCSTLARYYESNESLSVDKLQQFLSSSLLKLFSSEFYNRCVSKLRVTSCYLSRRRASSRHPSCLPSVGVILEGGHPHPLLTHESTDLLLSGVLSLVNTVINVTNSSSPNLTESSEHVFEYIQAMSQTSEPSLSSHWLSRHSSNLLYNLLTLYSPTLPPPLKLSIALSLSSLLHPQDSKTAESLFSRFLFNPSLLSSVPVPRLPLCLPTPSGKTVDTETIIKNSLQSLPGLCASYNSLLGVRADPQQAEVTSCSWPVSTGTLLPLDWPHYPLLSLYNSSDSDPSSSSSSRVTPELVRHSLSWLCLLPAPSSPALVTATWTRLATVLLSPGTLFLDPEISSVLHLNLIRILEKGSLDLSIAVPGDDRYVKITLY